MDRHPIEAPGDPPSEAASGWRIELGSGSSFAFEAGDRLIVRLAVEIDHGGHPRLASLYADVAVER